MARPSKAAREKAAFRFRGAGKQKKTGHVSVILGRMFQRNSLRFGIQKQFHAVLIPPVEFPERGGRRSVRDMDFQNGFSILCCSSEFCRKILLLSRGHPQRVPLV